MILLVEHDDSLRTVLKYFLENECKVDCLDAKDLNQAFKLLLNFKFTHFLLDYEIGDNTILPLLDFMALCPFRNRPIYILLTDYTTAKNLDIDYVFEKPLSSRDMDQLLNIVCEEKRCIY